MDILPDSRELTRRTEGKHFNGQWWLPYYCANCGVKAGYCPEDSMTFMFYLCDACYETHGQVAGTMAIPDEVFWENVQVPSQIAGDK